MAKVPPAVACLRSCGCSVSSKYRNDYYKYSMLVLTFFCYMSYHISRKPLSIVKGELHRNCSAIKPKEFNTLWHLNHVSVSDFVKQTNGSNGTWCDFAPFDKSNYKSLYGDLDYAFLISYALGMFFSGMIAERVSLRYFLSIGMILCCIFTAMFGFGYFFEIHSLTFYVFAQVLNGLAQTTGWPGVVACMGNWFGKNKRGLIMGIWNSHTSFGNIIGSVIASAFVGWAWGYSFVVPGIIIGFLGVVTFFTLVEHPEDVGIVCHEHSEAQYHRIPEHEVCIECTQSTSFQGGEIEGSKPPVVSASFGTHNQYHSIRNEDSNLNVAVDNCSVEDAAKGEAIGFIGALRIPGVIEFSLCLLFGKLVSYTFLFWLPFYIFNTSSLSTQNAGLLSTLFDVGGIFGGIGAGLLSDKLGGRAITCGLMLIIGAVMMFLFHVYGSVSATVNITLLIITGAFVNGPYALITTAVSADLGTHQVLQGNAKALSTVTAIIDGTGSIGAAIGPFLTGLILPTGWRNVFYMLIASNLLAVVLLLRLITKEFLEYFGNSAMKSPLSDPQGASLPKNEVQANFNINGTKASPET
uniref:Sugar phosphate exchanger 2 n=1 Tax=Phallusia mammillata TaxID=59560 RepID=A0A6F9DTB4_9ASCI|nr:sugar phosphate exchanger 2 [Phallusia mammillata]